MDTFLEKLYNLGCRVVEKIKTAWGRFTDQDKKVVGGVGIGSVVGFLLGGAIIQAGVVYGAVMLATVAILLSYFPKAQNWVVDHFKVVDLVFTVSMLIVGLYGGVIQAVGLMFVGFFISAYLRILRAGKEVHA